MIKPNIFLVGVQKAGTTSLYHFLREHPRIYGPDIKDYSKSHPFFSDADYFNNRREDFERLFNNTLALPHVITSDVDLIEEKSSLERIKQYNPDAKIIVSLRNPIDRLRSMLGFYRQTMQQKAELDWENESDEELTVYLNRSLYYSKIRDLYEVFDPARIKIVFFEDFTGTKFNEVRSELFKFLEVEQLEKSFIHENKTRELRYPIVNKLLQLGRGTKLRKKLVHNVIDKFFDANRRSKFKKRISEWNLREKKSDSGLEIPEKIRGLIREDVKKLEILLGKDLLAYWSLD